jgi:hypothetical protein
MTTAFTGAAFATARFGAGVAAFRAGFCAALFGPAFFSTAFFSTAFFSTAFFGAAFFRTGFFTDRFGAAFLTAFLAVFFVAFLAAFFGAGLRVLRTGAAFLGLAVRAGLVRLATFVVPREAAFRLAMTDSSVTLTVCR